jgi:hypothetical protein
MKHAGFVALWTAGPGALPNSLSPEIAKGTSSDNLIIAPLARSRMINIAIFED